MTRREFLYRDMFEHMRGMHLLAGAAAGVLALLLWQQGQGYLVAGWLSLMWLLQLMQEGVLRHRGTGAPASLAWRVRTYAGLNLFACLLWGVSPYLFEVVGFWQLMAVGLFLLAVTLVPAVHQAPMAPVYALSALLCMGPFVFMLGVIRVHAGSVLLHPLSDSALAILVGTVTLYAIHLSFASRRRALRTLEREERHDRAERTLTAQAQRLRETQAHLDTMRDRDGVTGLSTLEAFCRQWEDHTGQTASLYAVAINVVDFRAINLAYGWDAGNYTLSTLAQRLAAWAGNVDHVARIGADEFVCMLRAGPEGPREAVAALLKSLQAPVPWSGRTIRIALSAGSAGYPHDADNPVQLVECALLAMRLSHERDGLRYGPFESGRSQAMRSTSNLRWDLAHAMEREEFDLHFQPKIALADGRFAGVEALLRWNHPTHGPVPPERFIAIGEDSGLIVPIGQWVMNNALRAAAAMGLPRDGHVAVNVSLREFVAGDLERNVRRALDASGLPPSALQVELTESAVMSEPTRVLGILHRLREMGVAVALDDFGTGYSSLRYLRDLPIDLLKLDHKFLENVPADRRRSAIVRAVLQMAGDLGIDVVSEGVENVGQRNWLARHGCTYGQGYLFGRPMTAGELGSWLARHNTAAV